MIRTDDTICAPATGTGGAISIIRVSGQSSLAICSKVFLPSDRKIVLSEQKGYNVILGEIRNGNTIIDEVLLTVFRAPHSYTGEDSCEISCHSSAYIVNSILAILIESGAVPAKPGEFTMRAFFNGKMDLSQAEAVADLIASRTRSSHSIALRQLKGGFSTEISRLRNELLNFASLIELELDFGEEDVEFADRTKLKAIIHGVKDIADKLAGSFKTGNAIKNGIPVAIVGKPNSGKSTLLNALLMEERALVSDIPGTTRDAIEDTFVIEGFEFRFIDTAGLRDTTDVVENLGIKRTHDKIELSEIILLVDEISDSHTAINERADTIRGLLAGRNKSLFILINKCDTGSPEREADLKERVVVSGDEALLFISARNRSGLDMLTNKLKDIANKNQ